MNYSVIEKETGCVLRSGIVPDSDFLIMSEYLESNEFVIDRILNDATEYYLDGEVLQRPPMDVTVNGTTISGIPIPAVVYINYREYEVTEDTLELSFDTLGEHKVLIRSFPYLDKEVTIET